MKQLIVYNKSAISSGTCVPSVSPTIRHKINCAGRLLKSCKTFDIKMNPTPYLDKDCYIFLITSVKINRFIWDEHISTIILMSNIVAYKLHVTLIYHNFPHSSDLPGIFFLLNALFRQNLPVC